jgi:hypothetical protein
MHAALSPLASQQAEQKVVECGRLSVIRSVLAVTGGGQPELMLVLPAWPVTNPQCGLQDGPQVTL